MIYRLDPILDTIPGLHFSEKIRNWPSKGRKYADNLGSVIIGFQVSGFRPAAVLV